MKISDDINSFRKYVDDLRISEKQDSSLDLSGMNIFDGLRIAVLSSVYLYQISPEEKLKCKIKNNDLLMSFFNIENLEFV